MNKNKTILLIIFLILLVSAGGWFYYFRISAVNYLIPGVPYNGIYNLFYRNAGSPAFASVATVLGYWGDKRFDIPDLREEFFYGSSNSIKNFLEKSGYEVYQWGSEKPGNEIKEIKKFANPEKKIPVIVFQKRSLVSSSVGPRVVIGIFDKEKKLIVHDNLLGNNYTISYQDFEKMFTSESRAILAVWPSEKIKGAIEGPDYNTPYPARLEAMDKLSSVLSKMSDATLYRWQGDFEKANALYEELTNDSNFSYFPKAFQVSIVSAFANNHVVLKQFNEAIKIINERVLPINKNLSEMPSGWTTIPVDKLAYPYYVLALSYLGKGERNLALTSYQEMKSIREQSVQAAKANNYNDFSAFLTSDIPELEK